MLRWLLFMPLVIVASLACGGSRGAAPTTAADDAPQLWMQVAGAGAPTVIFEAGGGDDSSVWAAIEPEIRLGSGVRTVLYDRAGLGKSAAPERSGPYKIDDEVAALQRGLARFLVNGPIVIVAHSYGGFLATLLAATDKRVVGLVLVDANLAEFFDDAELARLKAKYEPQLPELERKAPKLAKVMGPLIKAYPETVKRVKAAPVPATLPVIDIVAEKSWGDTDEENAAMRRVHDAFVAASPAREQIVAAGSGHYVMRDKPKLVIGAINKLLRRLPR